MAAGSRAHRATLRSSSAGTLPVTTAEVRDPNNLSQGGRRHYLSKIQMQIRIGLRAGKSGGKVGAARDSASLCAYVQGGMANVSTEALEMACSGSSATARQQAHLHNDGCARSARSRRQQGPSREPEGAQIQDGPVSESVRRV